jgi:hypothetical protein
MRGSDGEEDGIGSWIEKDVLAPRTGLGSLIEKDALAPRTGLGSWIEKDALAPRTGIGSWIERARTLGMRSSDGANMGT